ncbi:DUF6596 domain-containing protein [Sphingobacterium spiritivorum]|uniref:DUF6596 domain-containing protein n=1 Tax=Sphingobacterium spiritivorum TaxID=258 RepID=UPI003DA62C88
MYEEVCRKFIERYQQKAWSTIKRETETWNLKDEKPAMMCLQSSRLEARQSATGETILFEDQDRTL